jgi:hypothetical protein
MNRLHQVLLFILLGCLSLVSYKVTYSFFSNSAASNSNIFAAASSFPISAPVTSSPTPTPVATPATGSATLVVNEVFTGSSNSNDWVEIFNKTGASIDVTGWKVEDNTSTDTIPSSSPIPANGYGIVVSNNSSTSIPAGVAIIRLSDNQIGNGLNNSGGGGDRIILRMPNNTIVDQMNYGSDTAVFPSPRPLAPTTGNSLARHPNG